jgi:hypothetical protein
MQRECQPPKPVVALFVLKIIQSREFTGLFPPFSHSFLSNPSTFHGRIRPAAGLRCTSPDRGIIGYDLGFYPTNLYYVTTVYPYR